MRVVGAPRQPIQAQSSIRLGDGLGVMPPWGYRVIGIGTLMPPWGYQVVGVGYDLPVTTPAPRV